MLILFAILLSSRLCAFVLLKRKFRRVLFTHQSAALQQSHFARLKLRLSGTPTSGTRNSVTVAGSADGGNATEDAVASVSSV